MKQILLLLSFSFLLFTGCKPKSKNTDEKTAVDSLLTIPGYSTLIGSYVGGVGNNKITLLITRAVADTIEGRSVVGGNDRPFSGTVQFSNGIYTAQAKEPGDDQYDGAFSFSFNSQAPDSLNGSWKPNNPTAQVQSKDFSLKRRAFVYLVDVGMYPQASKVLLKDEEVANMLKADLQMMRNEIFARHGYCFKKKELREQFEDKDWYIPHTVDVKTDLTEIEKKNIALIKRYEKYADEFGDDYGR